MATDYQAIVKDLFSTSWDVRDGTVVPSTDSVTLADGAVKVDAAFLYADLAASSNLAKACPWETVAKIIRAYLACASRLITENDGEIRSFDGDRVMGVFMGDSKNSNAVRCARRIDYVVERYINPTAQTYPSIQKGQIAIRHCVGIDSGPSVAVRGGVRGSNDLIWIGTPPSFAAKLSEIREYPYAVYVSSNVHSMINDSLKGGEDWEARSYTFAGDSKTVYRTKFTLSP